MKLLLRRSQRSGSFSGSVIFCLDARVEFTPQERESIRRYKLHNQAIYNSEASQRALDKANASASEHGMGDWRNLGGQLKGLAYLALASMKLNISISSLEKGQHVECKSMDELLGAEAAIMDACENLKGYLDTAATFDGREVLIDFSSGEPEVIAQAAAQPMLAALPAPTAPPAPEAPPAAPARELFNPAAMDARPQQPPSEPLREYELVDGEAVPKKPAPAAAQAAPETFRGLYATAARKRSDDGLLKGALIVAGVLVIVIWLILMQAQRQMYG